MTYTTSEILDLKERVYKLASQEQIDKANKAAKAKKWQHLTPDEDSTTDLGEIIEVLDRMFERAEFEEAENAESYNYDYHCDLMREESAGT